MCAASIASTSTDQVLRILVTGASGQLGNELKRLIESGYAEIGPIPAAYQDAQVVYTDTPELDITDADAVETFIAAGIDGAPYDVIINGGAMTNVDGCEAQEDLAYAVNATGPENLARAAKAHGAKLVQVSTDYVFPGNQPGDRVETDEVAPLSAYGRTKLAGEQAVQATMDKYFIVRTAWLYGYVGKNFVKTMLNLAKSHDHVTVVNDQLGNPTSANDLAYEILKLALTDNYGIYHVTNEGTCSWADFATAIMYGANTGCEVIPCTSEEYKQNNPASADRPAFSSLANLHLSETIGNEMRLWQDALETYLERLPELGN